MTGQAVTVRVVSEPTGAELLAETVVPETSVPGLYSLAWTGAPAAPADMVALYKAIGVTVPEFMRMIRRPMGSGGGTLEAQAVGISSSAEASGSAIEAEAVGPGMEAVADGGDEELEAG